MYKCPNETIFSLVGDINEIVGHRYNSRHTYNTSNNNSGTTTHPTTRNLSKNQITLFSLFINVLPFRRKRVGSWQNYFPTGRWTWITHAL